MRLVSQIGPIAVYVSVGNINFALYSEGIYTPAPNQTKSGYDHAVLLVGYGSLGPGKDYWLIKNSWSEGWGEDGYAKLARNTNDFFKLAAVGIYPEVISKYDNQNNSKILFFKREFLVCFG